MKGAGSELLPMSGEIDERSQAEMSADVSSIHITPIGGNVFSDLGFEDTEAIVLQVDSRRTIARRVEMTCIQTAASLSQDYRATIIERLEREPAFAQALLDEAAELCGQGEEELGQLTIEMLGCRSKS